MVDMNLHILYFYYENIHRLALGEGNVEQKNIENEKKICVSIGAAIPL